MKGDVDVFLEVFGGVTIADAVKFLLAVCFLLYIGKKFRDYLNKRHDAEVKKDEQLQQALSATKQYPEYRKQSLEIQQSLETEMQSMRKTMEGCLKRIEKMEEDMKKRECNRLRDCILQNFRYFTSKEKNPMQAWTRMEAEAFWEIFKDYENNGGNGYVHTEVQPAMNRLDIIEMHETELITELMKSRG